VGTVSKIIDPVNFLKIPPNLKTVVTLKKGNNWDIKIHLKGLNIFLVKGFERKH